MIDTPWWLEELERYRTALYEIVTVDGGTRPEMWCSNRYPDRREAWCAACIAREALTGHRGE